LTEANLPGWELGLASREGPVVRRNAGQTKVKLAGK
jgi:hypothetical protein